MPSEMLPVWKLITFFLVLGFGFFSFLTGLSLGMRIEAKKQAGHKGEGDGAPNLHFNHAPR